MSWYAEPLEETDEPEHREVWNEEDVDVDMMAIDDDELRKEWQTRRVVGQ